MKNSFSKFLSVVLSLVMLLGMIPGGLAFAEGETTIELVNPEVTEGTNEIRVMCTNVQPNDWICIYSEDQTVGTAEYRGWMDAADGIVVFSTDTMSPDRYNRHPDGWPLKAGEYQVVLYANYGYTDIRDQKVLTVVPEKQEPDPTPDPEVSFEASAMEIEAGGKITFTYTGSNGDRDWIRISKKDAGQHEYIDWSYTNPRPDGEITFPTGGATEDWINTPGEYVAKLLKNDSQEDADLLAEPVYFTITEKAVTDDAVYYAKFGGTGDGTSPETPAGSIRAVVDSINAKYGEGDTVIVKLIKNENEPTDGKWDSAEDSVFLEYNPNGHSAKIIYESYSDDENDKSTLAFQNVFSADVYYASHMIIRGPTVFRNINIIDARNAGSACDIYAQYYDLEFSNVNLLRPQRSDGYRLITWNGYVSAGVNRGGSGALGSGGCLTIDTATLGSVNVVGISGYGDAANQQCMTQPETVIKLGAGSITNLQLDTVKEGAGLKTHFTGNVGVVLNGTQVKNYISNNTPTIDGIYRVIYNNGAKITNDSANGIVAQRKYLITPEAGILVDVTDEAGVYAVENTDNYAFAYNLTTNPKEIYYGQDTINIIKSGEYVIKSAASVEEIIAQATVANGYYSDEWSDNGNGILTAISDEPEGNNYYVKYGGTGIGKRPDAPAPTVAAVIKTINEVDGLGEGDVANVFIMQSDDWDYGKGVLKIGTEGSTMLAPEHHITTWGPSNGVAKHTATLNITSYDEYAPSYLAGTPKLGDNSRMVIGGPTIFSNIVIIDMRCGYRELATNGYNVTFGDGTAFAHIQHDQYDSVAKPWDGIIKIAGTVNACIGNAYTANDGNGGTVVFENAFTSNGGSRGVHISSPTGASNTFKNDVTVEFNNSAISTNVYWGTSADTSSVTFEKNFNFIVSNAASIDNRTFSTCGTINIGGGLQIIANTGAQWKVNGSASAIGTLPAAAKITADAGTWILKVNANDMFVRPTETAGTFAVADGFLAIASDEATGASVCSKNGTITLAAGTYTVTSVPAGELESREVAVKFDGKSDGNTYISGYTIALPVLDNSLFEEFVGWELDGKCYKAGELYHIPEDAKEINFVSRWSIFENTSVVFIDAANGNDEADGSTAANAVKTLKKAVELASAKEETTKKICVVGNLSFTGNMPVHSCEIIYTGDGSGNSVFNLNADYIFVNGPTKFENIKIVTTTSGAGKFISVNGNPIIMGDGITTDDKKIPLRLGYCGDGGLNQPYKVEAEINSGVYGTIDFGAFYNLNTPRRTPGADVVINGGTISALSFYADGYNPDHRGNVWTEDVNVVINGGNVAKVNIPSGDPNTTRAHSFEKAVQIIVNNGVGTALPASVEAAGGAWLIKAEKTDGCYLELTETAGTFKINGEKIALATSIGGSQYAATGELVLPEGSYEVKFVDKIDYINGGDKITVFNNCTIDFANEKHLNKEGKVFIGWTMADGASVDSSAAFKNGDIIVAKYIDFNEYDKETGDGDFYIKGAQIRTEGVQGLRFIVEKKNAFIEALPNAGEFGTLVLPTDLTWGRDMFIDQAQIVEWKWDSETKLNFSVKSDNGHTPATVVGERLFSKTDDAEQYTVCITNITEDKYYRFYSVKGYIKYTDLNGIDRVFYSDYYQTNLYKVALAALDDGAQPTEVFEAIKNYVEVARKDEYMAENYDGRKLLSGYDTTSDKDPNHAMYALKNGFKVREVTIETGKGDRDPVEIVHFADTHLNYINQKDMEIGDINTLSTYRGRAWLRDGSSVPKISTAMEYASFFDKTVITGDVMDYFSWGCAEVIQKMIIDRSNDVVLAIGNHEPAELMQQDMGGLSDKYTIEEKYARLQSFWPNDLIYHSEIIKNDEGTDMIMIVVLDNQRDRYWASQYEPLKADIEKARGLDIPILIFEHDPICTKNPNETNVKWFYEKGDYTDNSPSNNFSARFAGSNENDKETMDVYNLIVRNSDVIKGVFCGHWHNHMYTEIYAQNEDGTFKKDENGNQVVIPQHIVTANAYANGAAIKITVK